VETTDPILESAEFQVVSLDGKVWEFECVSPEETCLWVKAIEEQIKKKYSENVSHKRMNSSSEMEKKAVLKMEGNSECADCGQSNPEWASINHGCVLCIECSGIHRKMGAHVSRIRSLTLDEWSSDLVALMLAMGNKKHHLIWEARRPRTKPTPTNTREEREAFIRAKYISKEYLYDLPPSSKDTAELLLTAVKSGDIVNVMKMLPYARQEDIDRVHGPPVNGTALHVACSGGSTSIVQLLIWNRANINQPDPYNRPPLYYARQGDHSAIETILIASNCVDDELSRLSMSSDSGSTEVLHRTRS
jgi:Arf-GAP/GTPase/ANK repeat/PH domain-containing protein 1/3